jgi:hypothetical protein
MLTVGLNLKPRVKKGFDSDAQAFFTRVTVAGGTLSATEKLATNQLVLDMKSAGIWTSMKAIYPMVGASASACAQNLKSSSFTGTFSSGWTFASTGVTPNGTSAYFDTTLVPNTNLTTSSSHYSYYLRTNLSIAGNYAYGVSQVGNRFLLYPYSSGLGWISDMNDSTTRIVTNNPPSTGFINGTRTSTTSHKLFKDGTQIGVRTTLSTGSLPTINSYIGCQNEYGVANQFCPNQIAFHSLGNGLDDTQASAFYTNVQTFNTTLSRQV